jgi:hypothetical protein
MAVGLVDTETETHQIATVPTGSSCRFTSRSGLCVGVKRFECLSASRGPFFFCLLLVVNLGYFKVHEVELNIEAITLDREVIECDRLWGVCLG